MTVAHLLVLVENYDCGYMFELILLTFNQDTNNSFIASQSCLFAMAKQKKEVYNSLKIISRKKSTSKINEIFFQHFKHRLAEMINLRKQI